ncbi:MAG: hypothetical protein GFH27_549371n22 [Chloroflexi bacterium AL-W]|nr:hypothetical protein [Chloroflexi bacterium AL-W]
MTRNVLIIDDEANMRWVLGQALEQAGYTAHGASGGDESMHMLARNSIDLVLLDLKLRGEDGLAVLRQVRERWPDVVVMMLTAYGTVPNAVEAMHLGAADFLRKPFDIEEVMVKVARALERRTMQQQIAHLTATQFDPVVFKTLIGTSVVWQDMLRQAWTLVTSETDVLFVGESGSGRASVARAIHAASTRHKAPLIECDTRIYHDPLVTLFGNEHHEGLWAATGSGTLLIRHLDDVPEAFPMLGERLAESAGQRPRLFIITQHQSIARALTAQCRAYLTIPPLYERPGDIALLSRVLRT